MTIEKISEGLVQADASADHSSEKVIDAPAQRPMTQAEQAVMHRALMRSVRLVTSNGDRTDEDTEKDSE